MTTTSDLRSVNGQSRDLVIQRGDLVFQPTYSGLQRLHFRLNLNELIQ